MTMILADAQALRELQGWSNDGRKLEFIPNKNGEYIVDIQVLYDEYYAPIHEKLSKLPQIEYNEQAD